ncbi:SEL1-like repeat protein [Ramlibacter sp. USB13]|uniref:SEL1-like repeat protein n=1 Tax=Ramlibacter cellulosilyticus TaxID=2764187 RepID=A0A923MUH5_9BURK|nr:SEL1-like repeat protein [Ramlibacter cellulosilyticus]
MTALLAAAVISPVLAQSDEFDQGMNTMWEVLWHQSGTPTRLVRWEQDIKVRIYGVNLGVHKQVTLQALKDVGTEAGIRVIDVSDRPDAAQVANVSVEIVPDNMLEENQPCVTFLNFQTETRIDSAAMQMRNRDAYRCAYHEAMHVMGVRGHPAGKTVLSYFPSKVDGLLPLDRVMLRAWYSPRMRGGMTPFEVLPVLADELVASMPDRDRAMLSRDRFFRNTIDQMQSFADGQGDVPMIVKRSGKSTNEGIRFGRMEMSYFLGIAYLEGATVPQDSTQAVRWLQRAANLGSRTAQARLGAATAR